MKHKIYGFYHIATINHWKSVVDEQIKVLEESGLLAETEKVFVTVLGEECDIVELPDKFEIIKRDKNLELFEFPTLEYMHEFCKNNDCNVWYIHVKGVSQNWPTGYGRTECMKSWRKYMQHYVIENYSKCIEKLEEGFEAVGTELIYTERERPHFSGNFWWSKSSYIKRLALPDKSGRNNAEFWIGTGSPRWYNFHTIGKDLYAEPTSIQQNEIEEKIKACGSDSLMVFGGSWEGGYQIQQCPNEFAKLVNFLSSIPKYEHSLDIGIAAGGATRFLREVLNIGTTTVIDDGVHSAFPLWNENKKGIKNLTEFIGDSHSKEAREFLEKLNRKYELVFVDGDHTFEGLMKDWDLIQDFIKPGTYVGFHDIKHADTVEAAWNKVKADHEVLLELKDPRELGIGLLKVKEQKLKVYWFGYGGTSHYAEALRPMIEELGMTLTTIHEWENANVKWKRETWLEELKKADIIIIPCNYEVQNAKSNNRLTQAMSLGKPIICSPLPAYEKILKEYPSAALVAYNDEDWKKHLIWLRDSFDARKAMSTVAKDIAQNYSIDAIGKKWLNQFGHSEKVDIIIPTRNNLKCLQLCLDSIKKCTHNLYNIIVVDNGSTDGTKEYCEKIDIHYIRKEERLSFAKAINLGINASNSKYICLLNDDIIASNNWLSCLVDTLKENVGIVGPLSNCDRGWLHNHDISIRDTNFHLQSHSRIIDLFPGINTTEEIAPNVEEIYNYKSSFNEIKEQKWIAFYCVCFKRELIEKIGYLDEEFVNSGEDVDFCHRTSKMGSKIVQNYNSFVFHFGAAGRRILEKENKTVYQEEQKQTNIYLNEKYDKETVVIYSGPSFEKWDFRSIDAGGIGGSESWAIYLARELSKKYRVKLFADCPVHKEKDGEVEYLHYTTYNNFIKYNFIDYFISSRTVDTFNFPVRSKKNFVMIHDIWLSRDKIDVKLNRVDKYVTLSEWHKNFVSEHHNIPKEKLAISSNGINFLRFNQQVKRQKNRLIYSSSPDRGLDTLLYLFDFMKVEIPDLELHIFYGFENWQRAIEMRNNAEELKWMNKIKEDMKKPGVFYHGRIGQKDLAIEFQKASLLAYPTDFEETFCITAIEAQYAGVPVVSSNYAGLRTTVGSSGILLGNGNKGESYTRDYRIKFAEECLKLLKDSEYWKDWSVKGYANSLKYSWEKVAEFWFKLFQE